MEQAGCSWTCIIALFWKHVRINFKIALDLVLKTFSNRSWSCVGCKKMRSERYLYLSDRIHSKLSQWFYRVREFIVPSGTIPFSFIHMVNITNVPTIFEFAKKSSHLSLQVDNLKLHNNHVRNSRYSNTKETIIEPTTTSISETKSMKTIRSVGRRMKFSIFWICLLTRSILSNGEIDERIFVEQCRV